MKKKMTQNRTTKMGKKFLAVCLLALICTAMLSMTASAASAVAKIGTKSYTSLQEAFNAVKSGQTIKLQKNVTIGEGKKVTSKNNVSFTLDLNGKKIKTKDAPKVIEGGYVVSEKEGGYIVLKKGKMTVKNGTITGNWAMSKVGSGIYVKKGATLIVQSNAVCGGIENLGTVKLQKGTIKEICNEKGSTVSVTGGAMTGRCVIRSGKVTIKNVKMTGSIDVQDGTLSIKGGTFKGTDSQVLSGGGQVTISGGTFSNKATGNYESVIAARGGTWKIKGGTFQNTKGMVLVLENYGGDGANVTISGGKINGGKGENAAVVCKGYTTLTIKGGTIKSSSGRAISVNSTLPFDNRCNATFTLSGGKVECTSKSYPAIYVDVSEKKASGKISIKSSVITAKGTKVKYE